MTDEPDEGGLAAEYVLGTLDADERAKAEALRLRQPGFASLVAEWEDHFAPLIEAGRDVAPPSHLLQAILAALAPSTSVGIGNVVSLQSRVAMWRRATGLVSALAAALAIWIAVGALRPVPHAATYMAVLQQGAGGPAFLVSLNMDRREMTIVPAGTPAEADKSYELWMIANASAPKSLGVLDPRGAAHREMGTSDTATLMKATYAVTLEPRGGSPTGLPTSAPIFIGHLIDTAS